MNRWLTLAMSAALLVGCNDNKTEAPAAPAASTQAAAVVKVASAAPAAAPAPAAVAAAAADDDLATEEDFADDAEKTIDEKTFLAELDKLDKEITE